MGLLALGRSATFILPIPAELLYIATRSAEIQARTAPGMPEASPAKFSSPLRTVRWSPRVTRSTGRLGEGDRRELRVRAHGPGLNELLDTEAAGCLNKV